jgi:hypothetical protein
MKFLLPLLFLASCTTPQIISPLDKQGNPIHTVLPQPFFNSPDKTSEWLFWYTPIFLVFAWLIWKEIKKIVIKTPPKSEDK